ncbi:KUP/HAK/KT family potassium transporter, partial [Candidatus Woesebacteria bacterium]|nr:KUP/HAK/KT family potassium transporter [Candidatus Woesebacteria bacterium]
ALSLSALGVVYGDIGTSPLYAINEIFFGHGSVATNPQSVLGSISLVFWALTIVISFKYVFIVLRADNEGEGGVFALYSFLEKLKKKRKYTVVMGSLLVFAAGLLLGDGIITPAISVLSAVEGLRAVTDSLANYIVPITIAILTVLFAVQRYGTAKVGTVFGPIVVCWFVSIGTLGLVSILKYPQIISAVNPLHAISFLTSTSWRSIFWVLGAVMLTITGGEAMFADMGHFGRKPIRLSWFSIVYPALILNYFGQGAYLLSGSPVSHSNIFYSMVPTWALIPMVILATFATVIASQAMISGAFSLATQAVRLGFFPRLTIRHTHHEHEGQIYVPAINWILFIGCVTLVLVFRSSSALASAYGLAVSGDMVITSLTMLIITTQIWKWSYIKTFVIFIPLLIIDFAFLSSNTLKVFEGGFIPLGIAGSVWLIMKTWAWGRSAITRVFLKLPSMSISDLIVHKLRAEHNIPKTIIVMTPTAIMDKKEKIPALRQMFWDRYGMLPEHLIFLTVSVEKDPFIHGNRNEVITFYQDHEKGSIRAIKMKFGFMEDLDVEDQILALATHRDLHISGNPKNWLIHITQEKLLISKRLSGIKRIRTLFFRMMLKNSDRADHFFGLGNRVALSIEVLPVKLR